LNKFITSLLFIAIASCNIIKDNDDDVGAKKLLSSGSVQLMRVDSGTKLNFSLKSSRPINCEIIYWEDQDTEAPEEATKKHPCNDEDGVYKTIISTNLNGLNPNKNYRFRVRSWAEDAIDNVEETNVLESSKNSFSITNKTRYIIKNQLNKNVGGVFALSPSAQASFDSLETGCQTTLPEPDVVAEPLYAKSISFSGFTNSTGKNVQLPNPYVQFPISSKNYELPLNLKITDSQGSKDLSFNAPLAFKSLEASSLNKISVPSFREGDTPPSIRSSNGDSISLSWTDKGRATQGYVNVYIDDLSGNRLLSCRYDSQAGSANIDHQTVKNLSVGNYRISLELKSFESERSLNSLIISSDWRVIILKRS